MFKLFCLILMCMSVACGDSPFTVAPDVEEFDLDPAEQTEVEEASTSGKASEGAYTYVDSTLTLEITASSFACGPVVGTIVATVVELTPTTMVWTFQDDGGGAMWTRVDGGTEGVVGVWRTTNPDLFLILSADGSAQIFGQEELCDDQRGRNDNSCYEVQLSNAAITIDGDLSDWDAVGQASTLTDETGDYLGTDPGADLGSLKVHYTSGALYVLMGLPAGPSTSFQARQPPNSAFYRLTVKGSNGLSEGEHLQYSPELEQWETITEGSRITAAAGATGIEWQVDVSHVVGEGFKSVDLILLEPYDCLDGQECGALDTINCAFFAVPQ